MAKQPSTQLLVQVSVAVTCPDCRKEHPDLPANDTVFDMELLMIFFDANLFTAHFVCHKHKRIIRQRLWTLTPGYTSRHTGKKYHDVIDLAQLVERQIEFREENKLSDRNEELRAMTLSRSQTGLDLFEQKGTTYNLEAYERKIRLIGVLLDHPDRKEYTVTVIN